MKFMIFQIKPVELGTIAGQIQTASLMAPYSSQTYPNVMAAQMDVDAIEQRGVFAILPVTVKE